ncbi:16S rRNA processing protein RimM [Geothermobacter ehrlichii]|uniref:Ribosome maturation factor RimM n=1 Tax=Geothermobacter ehrlichii TaxID=213224 RepID=A0A5D3WHB9_9BACT|nr:ribosome maturation factor RimM [Geothermobacter ehrlichii]TYO96073.1 16S rRNA processing protein RimM [Geothermobacter ehrlichii]
MATESQHLALVGKVVGTHGLQGDLKVRSHPENQSALLAATCLYLRQEDGELLRLVPVRTGASRGNLLFRFRGYGHISRVEHLVGCQVLVDPDELERTEEEIFWFEIAGFEVVDRERGPIGRLVDMFRTAAHGIYVVDGPYGEVLIPAIPQFVEGLDAEARVLRVDVPPGLYPDA